MSIHAALHFRLISSGFAAACRAHRNGFHPLTCAPPGRRQLGLGRTIRNSPEGEVRPRPGVGARTQKPLRRGEPRVANPQC